MNNETLKNNLGEREVLSADEQKISHLIGSLEKVSAPNDFDFRLKARIANAVKKDFQPSIWQTLRYILPLTATAIVAGFIMIQAGLFSPNPAGNDFAAGNNDQPPSVNQQFLPANADIARTSNSNVFENINIGKKPEPAISEANPKNAVAVKNQVEKKQNSTPKNFSEDEPLMSRDSAVRQNKKPIFPVGLNPDNAPPQLFENNNNTVSAQEIFKIIGLETETKAGKIIVKSVKEKSLAEKSNVKVGDVVEAIDEQRLDQETLSPKFKGGKSITVTRDNKVLEIELKPN
ncbi:MAG: hypothetical protein ACR2F2_14090 [Pyrinomonadaceae bacterium]